MPAKSTKSTGESLQELRIENAMLMERINGLEKEIEEAELRSVREPLAVLEDRVSELRRIDDENNRRRWQLILGISICMITFAANLSLNFILVFSRKS
jgi:hypothetical protein